MDPALTAAAIGVGGTVIVGVAGFWANVRNTNQTTALTLRAIELTEQGQVTDRYSKAIEQLGADKGIDVRIGGIYALERIARDSPRDHPTIMEVLAAFVRDHSREQWPPAEAGAEPPERTTRPDVQAAVTVIARRTVRYDSQSQPIDLADAHLFRARLYRADLTGLYLARANLTRANLTRANLTGANLIRANLTQAGLDHATLARAALLGADLTDADLTSANLTHANLWGANLFRAKPGGANLTGANLEGASLLNAHFNDADLTDANLMGVNLAVAGLAGANLTGANLAGADLTGAHLTDVILADTDLTRALWPADVAVPEGWQRDTTDPGRLKRAGANSGNPPTDPASAV